MIRGPPEEISMAGSEGDLERGEQEGLTPKEPGMSDLIRSEYAQGRHLLKRHFTSMSSGVRSGRIPKSNATKLKT